MLSFNQYPIQYLSHSADISLNLDLYGAGANQTEEVIIYKKGSTFTVYDRICNHNNGRLSLNGETANCPLHGWKFNPSTGDYLNIKCSKVPLAVINEYELDSPLVTIQHQEERLKLHDFNKKYTVKVDYINHACLIFELKDCLKFATDPWIKNSAFSNGWWLKHRSPKNAFDRLNQCDFIYISHNHPDHLHTESLAEIRKDMPILTANFKSESTARYLRSLGFTKIFTPDFKNQLIDHNKEISLSVLKSGDFRDDSGLLLEAGDFSALLTVDSNFLDFGRYPSGIDLLCSSFAGGASGFPLCFEDYTENEKRKILSRNRLAIKSTNISSLQNSHPKFFMPYAGFFSESAKRDSSIKVRNGKNTISDYDSICKKLDVQLLNVEEKNSYTFLNGDIINSQKRKEELLEEDSPEVAIEVFNSTSIRLSDKQIATYFKNSKYQSDLKILIRLTDDDFLVTKRSFSVEFDTISIAKVDFSSKHDKFDLKYSTKRVMDIQIREHQFYDVLANGKPWEDLSIGFQIRLKRAPNIYNSDFWDHFTNIYTNEKTSIGG